MLQADVEGMRDPSEPLRMLWNLDHDPYPVNRISQLLEKAKRTAPDDDRVWLALADLATHLRRFKEADGWLTRCERARPDDGAVWDARLRWSRAAGRPDEVVTARAPLAAVELDAGGVARVACLDGRATWRPPRGASGPRIFHRSRAGRCRGHRATGRPGRARWRKRAVLRVESPQGGNSSRQRYLRATHHQTRNRAARG